MSFDILPLGNNFNELFTGYAVLGFFLIGLINAVLMMMIAYRYFQVFQQCSYDGYEFRKWLFRKDNGNLTRLTMLSQMSLLGFLLTNMPLSVFNGSWVSYCGFISYGIFLFVYLQHEYKQKHKLPLVLTKRMVRLMITFVILTIVFSMLSIFLVNGIALLTPDSFLLMNFRYAILCVFPVLVPFVVILAYIINSPYENAKNRKFAEEAAVKLASRENLIKIGITGSFGKTTVKEILKTILSNKYKVLATPESYNTPLGLAKTIGNLEDSHDVFIAEMGARKVGDIKELTNLVKPDIAVITGITGQHLETFLTINNVKKTKYEIIENMVGGKAFFSNGDKYSIDLYNKCPLEKNIAGISDVENPTVYATDITVTEEGTDFTLISKDEKIKCKTALYGRHNVADICIAAAVALSLGVTLGEIAEAITRIKPVKHRLELTVNENGVKILDDGYNANPEGVMRALDVLKAFSGKKYVVTPGIVELGIYEAERNYEFGVELAKVCDGVILVGRGSTLRIREGLLSAEYPSEKITMVKDLDGVKEELAKTVSSGDSVLFINDLPDKYN